MKPEQRDAQAHAGVATGTVTTYAPTITVKSTLWNNWARIAVDHAREAREHRSAWETGTLRNIQPEMHASMVDSFADGLAHERNVPGLPTAWAIVGLSTLRSGVDIASVDPVRTIGTLGDRPVLLIHGTDDILDTVDHAAKPNLAAAKAGGVPVTIRYCEGGRHGHLVDTCPDEWQAWVNESLGGIPELRDPTPTAVSLYSHSDAGPRE